MLYMTAVGTLYSLLGLPANGQAVLYLSQTFTMLRVHYCFGSCGWFWNGYKTLVGARLCFTCYQFVSSPTYQQLVSHVVTALVWHQWHCAM